MYDQNRSEGGVLTALFFFYGKFNIFSVSYSVYSWTQQELVRNVPRELLSIACFLTRSGSLLRSIQLFVSGTIHMCNDSMVISLPGGHDSMAIHQVPMINATGNLPKLIIFFKLLTSGTPYICSYQEDKITSWRLDWCIHHKEVVSGTGNHFKNL